MKKIYINIAIINFVIFGLFNNSFSAGFSSPAAMAANNLSGGFIYIAQYTGNRVDIFDTTLGSITGSVSLPDSPTGVAVSDGNRFLYVTAGEYSGKLFTIDIDSGKIVSTLDIGHSPNSPVLSNNGNRLFIANQFANKVQSIDLTNNTADGEVNVIKEPIAMAITPEGNRLVVANHLPAGAANTSVTYASVSVIDTDNMIIQTNIPLPDGSTGLRGICISPDGKYAYVTHISARYHLPTTQLDRGWVVTNAVSIINLSDNTVMNTVLLDDVYKGAANPWAVSCSADGKYLCVTHAGTHEVSIIDRQKLHERLTNVVFPGGFSNEAADVPHDLGFLTGLRRRIQLPVNGPRAIAMSDNTLYVAGYFSGNLCRVKITDTSSEILTVEFDSSREPDQARKGEMIFNDAGGCYQNWLSCASCHPNMRSDGLNWDLGNDGYGSPRQVKSLLKAHSTAPTTVTGCRPNAETSVRAGFKYIEFVIKSEEDSASVDTYIKSVKAVPSPYLVDGGLSESAKRGKSLFQNRCGSCHSGEFYTDMNSYDVGTGRTQGELLDTPTLVEVWRTAPYLQDGRAATITDVLTTYNANDQHGQTADLSEAQLKDLEAFILTIGSAVTVTDTLDLKQAVNILQILAGTDVQNISLESDTDGNGKISLAETVYILQKVSGLRQ